MNRIKKNLDIFIIFILLLLLAACSRSIPLTEEEENWLQIHNYSIHTAVGLIAPPLGFYDANGDYTGLSADYVDLISEKLDISLNEVVVENWVDNIEKVQNGKIDIITMQRTVEREKTYVFTEPYLQFPYIIVTRKENEYNLVTIEEMAVVKGYLFADYIKQEYSNIRVIDANNNLDALNMVNDGKAQGCGINLAYASYLITKNGLKDLIIADNTEFLNSLSFAVSHENKALASILDKTLLTISEEEGNRLYNRWIELQRKEKESQVNFIVIIILIALIIILIIFYRQKIIRIIHNHHRLFLLIIFIIALVITVLFFLFKFLKTDYKLTEEEQTWLNNNEINIATCVDIPPYAYTNMKGDYVGIAVDIRNLIEKNLHIEVNDICIEKREDLVDRFIKGEITISLMEKTKELDQYFDFTKTILTTPNVLISSKDSPISHKLENMDEQILLIAEGDPLQNFIAKKYPDIFIERVPNEATGLLQVSFGKSHVFAGNLAICNWIIKNKGISNLEITEELEFSNKLSIATGKKDRIFHNIIDKYFESIPDKELNEIQDKWMRTKREGVIDKKSLNLLLLLSTVVFAVILFVILWNYFLRRTVRHQTKIIRENEQKSGALIRAIPDMIYLIDSYGNFTNYKNELEELHTPEKTDIFPDMIFPDNIRELLLERVITALKSGKIEVFIYQIENGKKEVEFFETRMVPINHNTALAIIRNISKRKQQETELFSLRNYLSNIIDSMPSILIGIDKDGRVTLWNKTAEESTGINATSAYGKNITEVFPQMTWEMDKFTESIKTGKIKKEQRKNNLSDKGMRYEDITLFPLTTKGGEGVVIRIDDVTEQVQLEEIMAQSEKMLSVGGLAAGMAHEINNPLAGMIQTAGVMAGRLNSEKMPANKKAAEEAGTTMKSIKSYMEKRGILQMVQILNESGHKVAEIVENVLSFARKTRNTETSHNPIQLLDSILEKAAKDYNLIEQYNYNTITIKKEYQENLPKIECEKEKIHQVIFNILRNGAEAMHEYQRQNSLAGIEPIGSVFIIRLLQEKNPDMIRIEIEDNGPGMDEAVKKRIFEPFFTTKSVGDGTGLGLSISYFIITENHKGTMAVKSNPEKGTIFIIKLPF